MTHGLFFACPHPHQAIIKFPGSGYSKPMVSSRTPSKRGTIFRCWRPALSPADLGVSGFLPADSTLIRFQIPEHPILLGRLWAHRSFVVIRCTDGKVAEWGLLRARVSNVPVTLAICIIVLLLRYFLAMVSVWYFHNETHPLADKYPAYKTRRNMTFYDFSQSNSPDGGCVSSRERPEIPSDYVLVSRRWIAALAGFKKWCTDCLIGYHSRPARDFRGGGSGRAKHLE